MPLSPIGARQKSYEIAELFQKKGSLFNMTAKTRHVFFMTSDGSTMAHAGTVTLATGVFAQTEEMFLPRLSEGKCIGKEHR